jgi:hypothetical protein
VNVPRSLPTLAIALIAAVPLAGCGSSKLNTDKAETEIEKGLKNQLNLPSVDVQCPNEVEIKAGSKFQCPVTAGKEKGTIEVTQQDDQGNIRWQLKQQSVKPSGS